MRESEPSPGVALARAHQALYRFGALASADRISLAHLEAAAELLRARIVFQHPDALVRATWREALELPGAQLRLSVQELDPSLLLERSFSEAPEEMLASLHRLYLRSALQPAGVAPDELTVELDLAAELCAREAIAREANDAEAMHQALLLRHELLSAHLVRWLPLLHRTLEQSPRDLGATKLVSALLAAGRFDWHRLETALFGEEVGGAY